MSRKPTLILNASRFEDSDGKGVTLNDPKAVARIKLKKLIQAEMAAKFESPEAARILNVSDESFMFQMQGKTYKQTFITDGDELVFEDFPEEVAVTNEAAATAELDTEDAAPEAESEPVANHIVKLANGKYRLLSHEGKNLGTFDSHEEAAKHEGQVEWFKAHNSEATFNTVVMNLGGPKIRYDMLEGKQHMVVPMVMITNGVHHGSGGPLLYPEQELRKTPESWNYKPITLDHPTANGQGISACDPVVINSRKLGVIMNTKAEMGKVVIQKKEVDRVKLNSEAWLDPDRLKALCPEVLEALEKKQMVEVSTGLFTDNEATCGEWNGEKYVAIARNYRPDHLAILIGKKGSCSIADGAGLLRNEKGELIENGWTPEARKAALEARKKHAKGEMKNAGFKGLKEIQQKYGDNDMLSLPKNTRADYHTVSEALQKKGWKKTGERDYARPESSGFGGEHTLEKGGHKITVSQYRGGNMGMRNPPRIQVHVPQEPTSNSVGTGPTSQSVSKENVMDKAAMIALLVANSEISGWCESDRPWLEKQEEKRLQIFVGNTEKALENAKCADDDMDEEDMAEEEADKKKGKKKPVKNEDVVNQAPKTRTLQEYLTDNSIPEEIREMASLGLKTRETERAGLLKTIVSNSKNTFTQEYLAKRSTEELRGLAALAAPAVQNMSIPGVNFRALADVTTTNSEKGRPPLLPPVLDFGKK